MFQSLNGGDARRPGNAKAAVRWIKREREENRDSGIRPGEVR
jgi:hypothetical protein